MEADNTGREKRQHPTRREVLRAMSLGGAATAFGSAYGFASGSTSGVGLQKAAATADDGPAAHRLPMPPTFSTLPLGSIRAQGWLLDVLRTQADGLSGHLGEIWADVGAKCGWLGGSGEAWERGPYYLDGLVPLAYLLDDPRLKQKTQKFIDWVLDHQAPNGMIGPQSN